MEKNKDHPTDESTVHDKVTPSAAMEMVLAAYYRGLIDQVCMMDLFRFCIFRWTIYLLSFGSHSPKSFLFVASLLACETVNNVMGIWGKI